MHDGHRIGPNLKFKGYLCLSSHVYRRIVLLLRSSQHYHCLTEVLLVAKTFHDRPRQSLADFFGFFAEKKTN
ncbi:hypothetical protein MXB_1798 [Myxobolus squamalis]|nr:hypothetical protein MXB_1798 [Myxobolus squamalis]